jgi:hypothetical protein
VVGTCMRSACSGSSATSGLASAQCEWKSVGADVSAVVAAVVVRAVVGAVAPADPPVPWMSPSSASSWAPSSASSWAPSPPGRGWQRAHA